MDNRILGLGEEDDRDVFADFAEELDRARLRALEEDPFILFEDNQEDQMDLIDLKKSSTAFLLDSLSSIEQGYDPYKESDLQFDAESFWPSTDADADLAAYADANVAAGTPTHPPLTPTGHWQTLNFHEDGSSTVKTPPFSFNK